jgi:DNA-directed RNA polymerase subunit RPC12/RpoP
MRWHINFLLAGAALTATGGALAYWDYAYHGAAWLPPLLGVMAVVVVATLGTGIAALKAPSPVASGGRVRVVHRTPAPAKPERSTSARGRHIQRHAPSADAHELLPPGAHTINYEQGATLVAPLRNDPIKDPSTTVDPRSTNILCGTCGTFFELELHSARPVPVDCPGCNIALLVEGNGLRGPAVDLFCQACHATGAVPRAENVASYICSTCGHINRLRAVGEARATVAHRTPSMHH